MIIGAPLLLSLNRKLIAGPPWSAAEGTAQVPPQIHMHSPGCVPMHSIRMAEWRVCCMLTVRRHMYEHIVECVCSEVTHMKRVHFVFS